MTAFIIMSLKIGASIALIIWIISLVRTWLDSKKKKPVAETIIVGLVSIFFVIGQSWEYTYRGEFFGQNSPQINLTPERAEPTKVRPSTQESLEQKSARLRAEAEAERQKHIKEYQEH